MKPGTDVAAVGATAAALTLGAVLSTVTVNPTLAALAALSVAVMAYERAPAGTLASAVRLALRHA